MKAKCMIATIAMSSQICTRVYRYFVQKIGRGAINLKWKLYDHRLILSPIFTAMARRSQAHSTMHRLNNVRLPRRICFLGPLKQIFWSRAPD